MKGIDILRILISVWYREKLEAGYPFW